MQNVYSSESVINEQLSVYIYGTYYVLYTSTLLTD